jgi:hypothetical protein
MRVSIRSADDEITLDGAPTQPFAPHRIWGILKDGIDGWFGAPSVRETPVAKPAGDGAYRPATLTTDYRVVTIRGFIRGLSTIEIGRVCDRLNAMVGKDLVLTVEDVQGPRWTRCYISTDTTPVIQANGTEMTFGLVLTCPDPYRYGAQMAFQASGGIVCVENPGDLPVWPKIHVDGQLQSLTISLGSQSVCWSGDSRGLDLDFTDMIPSAGTVGADDAFTIPPGRSVLAVQTTEGAAVSVSLAPAWR